MAVRQIRAVITVGAIGLATLFAGDVARAADWFVLTSSSFRDGDYMPKKHANSLANSIMNNPNCVGENISPALSWSNPPAGTKSYALTMTDPSGGGGSGIVHMVVYGIEPTTTSFAEGELSKPSTKWIGGRNDAGYNYYRGPCTPPGAPHHYMFILMATDLEPTALPPGLTLPELHARLKDKVKRAVGLVGMFKHD